MIKERRGSEELIRHRLATNFFDGLILDVGSGTHPLRLSNVITLDQSKDTKPMIIADVTKGIPLRDRSVNSIYCSHVLEHLENYDQAFALLKEFKKILKRGGGKLLIIVPSVKKIHVNEFPHHHRLAFTTECLEYLVRLAGFSILSCTRRIMLPFLWRFPCPLNRGEIVLKAKSQITNKQCSQRD